MNAPFAEYKIEIIPGRAKRNRRGSVIAMRPPTVADFPFLPWPEFDHTKGKIGLLHINASSIFARLNERGEIASAVTVTMTYIDMGDGVESIAYGYHIDVPTIGTFVGQPLILEPHMEPVESADNLTLDCDKVNPSPLTYVSDGPCSKPLGHDGPCNWIPAGMPLRDALIIPEVVMPASGPPDANGNPPTSALVDAQGVSMDHSGDVRPAPKRYVIGGQLHKDSTLDSLLGGEDR